MDRLELYNKLKNLPNVEEKDDYWLATRCVLCGDSAKDPHKKRLYIHIDPTNPSEPIGFNCFNCMRKGIVTQDMLRKIGLGENAYLQALVDFNNQASALSGTQKTNKYRKMKTIPVTIPPPTKKPEIIRKIKYLYKERLNFLIPVEDLSKLKIIWKLTDFLKANGLYPNRRWIKFLRAIDNDYIGFLSVRNEYIIFRDITDSHKYRYIKYGLFSGLENASSYYAIDSSVNALSKEPIQIIVAEGTFDVIGLLYHVYNGDLTNRKFVSSSEGDFKNPIMYHINQGLVGENIDILCYVDNDTIADYDELKRVVKPYVNSISFYHNTKYKDFGTSRTNIEIEEFDLLIAKENRKNFRYKR